MSKLPPRKYRKDFDSDEQYLLYLEHEVDGWYKIAALMEKCKQRDYWDDFEKEEKESK